MFAVIPLFNFGHYNYTWREALVISWGGLRGAVGLALAVAVFGDEIIPTTRGGIRMFGDNDGVPFGAFDDQSARMRYQQVRARARAWRAAPCDNASTPHHVPTSSCAARACSQIVLLHVSMIVLLTLMVNAPTSGFILKKIGLTKLTNERATMLQLAQSVRHPPLDDSRNPPGGLGALFTPPLHVLPPLPWPPRRFTPPMHPIAPPPMPRVPPSPSNLPCTSLTTRRPRSPSRRPGA